MKAFRNALGIIILSLTVLALFGCNFAPAKTEGSSSEESQANFISLEKASDFDASLVNIPFEVSVYDKEHYDFSNKNEAFCKAFSSFLKHTKVCPKNEEAAGESITVTFFDGKDQHLISLFETDLIKIGDSIYFSDGIYQGFKSTFADFLKENKKYCRSAATPIRFMYEYAVYDANGAVMESEYLGRAPQLFYNEGIVHLKIQAGTGSLTQCAKFFDVTNKVSSPEYVGQTDYFGETVLVTASSKITLHNMFSGEEIGSITSFEKPLGNCAENIVSAYFSKDGKQITVEYLDAELKSQQQVFDITA